jgi:hypothetical protein
MSTDFMSLLQDFIPEAIPRNVKNAIWTWVWFSTVTELWTEIKDDLNNRKHNYICTSSVTGTLHFSQHVTEYLSEQIPDQWIGCGGLQNWPLQSTKLSPRFPCMELHEKHGVWMQNKQKRGTISLNFQCWKMHEWPWGSNHLVFQISIAPYPLRIGPMFISHFWLGTTSGIRSWSTDIMLLDTRYNVIPKHYTPFWFTVCLATRLCRSCLCLIQVSLISATSLYTILL